MLIDRSYFIGDLNIPGTDRESTQERLDFFIEKYETEILKNVFGYQFYNAFMQGLTGSPVAQIWMDLLQGVEYTDFDSRIHKWEGIIEQPGNIIDANNSRVGFTIIVGNGGQFDPIPNSDRVAIPPEFVGRKFIFVQRAFGQLDEDEYTIDTLTNELVLLGGQKFSNQNRYYYYPLTIGLQTTSDDVKRSFIANFIYYQWQKDQYTQTVGLGEVATKAENAQVVSPQSKMIRAWNEMADRIEQLMHYLLVRQADYKDWWTGQIPCTLSRYRKINQFNT